MGVRDGEARARRRAPADRARPTATRISPGSAAPELDGALVDPLLGADGALPDPRGRRAPARPAAHVRRPWRRRPPQPVALRPAALDRGSPGPAIPIIDSTHIVEYRGGGYPLSSVLVEDAITHHHVISPTLRDWMVEDAGRRRRQGGDGAPRRPHRGAEGRRVPRSRAGGRAVHRRVRRSDGTTEGARGVRRRWRTGCAAAAARCASSCTATASSRPGSTTSSRATASTDVVVRRDSTVPVDQTLDEAHLLVVTSHNEGLTLTTLEAIAHGVPVVSTDVGAQSDIIPPTCARSRAMPTGLSAKLADARRGSRRR